MKTDFVDHLTCLRLPVSMALNYAELKILRGIYTFHHSHAIKKLRIGIQNTKISFMLKKNCQICCIFHSRFIVCSHETHTLGQLWSKWADSCKQHLYRWLQLSRSPDRLECQVLQLQIKASTNPGRL